MLLKPARSKKAPRSELPLRRGAEIPSPPRKRSSSCRPTAARIPRASGIYRIVCKPTGQFYVGSAVNLHERLRSHWTALRRGKHANKYLQRAWKRYREVNFEFKVVELVKPSRLLAAEQSWLKKTRCIDRNIGFNILPHALSSSSLTARTWKGFFDPRGRPVSIKNLHKFCRENRLCFAAMAQLHHGKSKLKSYKGWTHSEGREALSPKKHTGFIRPDGRPTVIINLARFCRESGLSVVHMHNLKSGIRRIHKGWTWRGA